MNSQYRAIPPGDPIQSILHNASQCHIHIDGLLCVHPNALMFNQLDPRRQRYMAESEASRASELGGPGASTLSELIDQVAIFIIIKLRIHL